jgi:hypothetical protein
MLGKHQVASFRKTRNLIISFVLISLVSVALIALAISKSLEFTVQNSAKITFLGVEGFGGDLNSFNGVFSIDWGQIYVGDSANATFYLRSVSNVPATLALNIDSWEPEGIEHFIFVSWNYSGTQIAPREEIPIRIDLNTADSADFVDYLITNNVTYFSFRVSISALER